MANWLQWLESKLGRGENGTKWVKTFQWVILLVLTGVALMILNSFLNIKPVEPEESYVRTPPEQEVFLNKEASGTPFEHYERQLESRLKEILEKIVGVGQVDAMVTIESTEETVVYRDMHESEQETNERDVNGAQRHITSVTRDGKIALYTVSGENRPIVLRLINPEVRGVLIVANGAENATVKKMLMEAVQRGLNISPARISIVPRKTH